MSAAATAEVISLKLIIQRKRDSEIRRFAAPNTFDELVSIIAHLWNGAPKNPSVEYIDEDGDRIRMSSACEWDECIRLFKRNRQNTTVPLVVYTTRRGKKPDPKAAEAKSESDEEPEVTNESQDDADASPTSGSDETAAHPCPAVPPLSLQGAVEAQMTNGGASTRSARIRGGEEVQSLTMQLLSELFGCNAEEVLCSADVVSSPLGPVILSREGSDNEVFIDVDRTKIRRKLIDEANGRIARNDNLSAEKLLRMGLRVFPNDAALYYNLGCALARQNKIDDALAALAKSVGAGYDDFAQMMADADLASIRGDARFQALAAVTPRGPRSQVVPPVPTPPVIAAVTPAPTPAVPTSAAPVERLVEMFPTITHETAARVLATCNGDLNVAVLRILSIAV